jgi:hypothetical protein
LAEVKEVTPMGPRQGQVKPRPSKPDDVTEKDGKCYGLEADGRGAYGQAHPTVQKGRRSPKRRPQEQILTPSSGNPHRELRVGERAAQTQNPAGKPDPQYQRWGPEQLRDGCRPFLEIGTRVKNSDITDSDLSTRRLRSLDRQQKPESA